MEAHRKSCRRDNVSTVVLRESWNSNGQDLYKSITAAMMTLGGIHAPIKRCYVMIGRHLRNEPSLPYDLVPGFGSSFFKGAIDPILYDLSDYINVNHTQYEDIAIKIHNKLIDQGKNLYPNIAFYTAAVAHIEQQGILFCEKVLIEARIPEWIKILQEYEKE